MKSSSKFLVACLLAFGVNSLTFAQDIPEGPLSFTIIPGDSIPKPHNPHRGDPIYNLPTVNLDGGLRQLLFESCTPLSLPYYIKDTNGYVCLSGSLVLETWQPEVLPLTGLNDGSYTLFIVIDNSLFAASFCLKDEW